MKNGNDKPEPTLSTIIEGQAAKIKDKVADIDWNEVPGEVKTYVRSKPWKSLAIALGLGFLAGFIIKSNKGEK